MIYSYKNKVKYQELYIVKYNISFSMVIILCMALCVKTSVNKNTAIIKRGNDIRSKNDTIL